jgi:hypothetical protein
LKVLAQHDRADAALARPVKISAPLPTQSPASALLKSKLARCHPKEIYRHDFSTFVDEPPLSSQGGKGVVVAGCPACRKRLQSMNEFLDHLAKDVMPKPLDRLSSQ